MNGTGGRAGAVDVREAATDDLKWIVARHRDLYARERGWDERFGRLVAEVVEEFRRTADPERERAWIARVEGRRAGCILCVAESERVAKLRLLLVEPEHRGAGIGTRLIGTCVAFARSQGYERVVLWTNDVLTEAARLYRQAGFRVVDSAPHRMFGPAMTGQTYALELTPGPGGKPDGAADRR